MFAVTVKGPLRPKYHWWASRHPAVSQSCSPWAPAARCRWWFLDHRRSVGPCHYVDPMNVEELRAKIRTRHANTVRRFRAAVLGPEGRNGPGTVPVNGRSPFPSISHPSVTDRHAAISVVGEVAELAWLHEDRELAGFVLTLSIAGRHRVLGERMSLSVTECDAWISEIIGEDLLPFAYRAGGLSGTGVFSTSYYKVFLDEHRLGIMKPAGVDHPQVWPLSGL